MKKKIKLLLVIIILILIGVFVYKNINSKSTKKNVKVIDSITNFSYTLDERDTTLMKDTYNELKDVLNKSDINYEEYAKIIAKLFIIDLYTLDNKINKYDVGSLEYVYPDSKDNFKLKVEDTLYKSIVDNTFSKRNNTLPIVNSIVITDVTNSKYTLQEKDIDTYIVSLKWDYEKDLGYDKEGYVTLIKEDNKVYVVEYKAGVLDEKDN